MKFSLKLFVLFSLAIFLNNNVFTQSCIEFDGVDDYIEVQNSEMDSIGANDFTFEAIVNGTSIGQNQHPMIFSKRSSISSGTVFFFHAVWGSSAYKMLSVQIEGYNYYLLNNGTFNGDILDGTCRHVAISRVNNILNFYVDGNFIGDYPVVNNPTITDTEPIRIGSDRIINSTFNGHISQVRVWNSSRNQTEIMDNKI